MDLSTIDARRQLVSKFATLYGLAPELICAVIEQESSWNQWAIRPEPAFEERYVLPLHEGILETWSRSMSWGLMQLMGEVARELGFEGKYLSQLCDPDIGLLWSCKKLRHCMDATEGVVEAALQRWNGGANKNYSAEVMARIIKYT